MKLNLDFYNGDEKISEIEKSQAERFFSDSKNEVSIEELELKDYMLFSPNRKNIVSWYDFKENSKILELNPNFGEITGFLSEKAEKVVSILDSKIKGEAIKNRYEEVSNLEVIVGNIQNITINESFDYAIIIGIDNKKELIEKIKFAKTHLKNDGKILIAYDNKFGIKYWTGIKENAKEQYDQILGKTDKLSLDNVKKILEQEKLDSQIFYPLPDYRITNVIFSDKYMPNIESINSRHLPYYDENDYCDFSQRNAYTELLKNNPENFKFFANSYFFEISMSQDFTDTKYVNFEIDRREEYTIKTVIKEDFVYKTANSKLAEKHINTIKNNIEILNKNNINTLDSFDSEKIISKFAKNAISLDRYIVKVCEENGVEEAKKILEKFIKEMLGKFEKIEKPQNTIFEKYNIDLENSDNLHFIKDGLIDLCPQNCFYIDNEFYIYDQEWYEANVPIEFIIFRIIYQGNYLSAYISKNDLYEMFKISEYVDIFTRLEQAFQASLKDNYMWSLHVKSVTNIGKRAVETEELKSIIEKSNVHIRNLESKIGSLENNIKDFEEKVENLNNEKEELAQATRDAQNAARIYQEQIITISKSLSWKITKPLRYISWLVRGGDKTSLKDRLLPPGSKRRKKYDEAVKRKAVSKLKKKYVNVIDNKTAEYWAELEFKYIKEKENRLHDNNYDYWMDNNDVTSKELQKQRNAEFKFMPKISIVTPLYNTDLNFFRELLFFLVEQSYTNWELCLADGSEKPLEKIKKIIKKEPRVKYKYIGENKGISGNTNEALSLATGDYIGLLDHDDYLSKDALYEVVKTINENPEVEFIYSDEDKVTEVGKPRFAPYFKPDFSPDSLRSQNYICHFTVLKKELMNKLGGFRSKYDGAQDYDLFLRATELAKVENIKHISKILYHWRATETSTAMQGEAKPWAFDAGKLAIQDHLKRIGLDGEVKEGKFAGSYEVEYKVIGNPKVSIMIPNKDGIDILKTCIESILEKTTYNNYEINVIENNSVENETFKYYREIEKNPKINVLRYPDKGFNYSRIINFGARNSDGDFLIQLNNDTELITPNWLEKMIGYCQREDVGAVGACLYYPDGSYQHAGITIAVGGIAANRFKDIPKGGHGYFYKESMIENLSAVTAACIMTKKSIYEEVGYMNEVLEVAFNDVDFCLKIRKTGKLIVYNPFVEFWHYESKTRGIEDSPEKVRRFESEVRNFEAEWKDILTDGDPYYNKNLSLNSERYDIRKEKVN